MINTFLHHLVMNSFCFCAEDDSSVGAKSSPNFHQGSDHKDESGNLTVSNSLPHGASGELSENASHKVLIFISLWSFTFFCFVIHFLLRLSKLIASLNPSVLSSLMKFSDIFCQIKIFEYYGNPSVLWNCVH